MKLKKILTTITVGALLMGTLVACGEKKDDTAAQTTAAAETTAAAGEETTAAAVSADNPYISFNGVDVQIGMNWADIKDKLGSETKPVDEIKPCDGGDYIQIMHYFDGLTVTTLRDETVVTLSTEDGGDGATLMGQVKKGDSIDAVKSAMGEPDSIDEYQMNYTKGNASVFVYLENNVVRAVAFMKAM